jgi:heptaprenyl diphosphate synthase
MVASYLMSTAAIFSYLPFLLLLGIPTGLFTGFLAKIFLDRFAQIKM